MTKKRKAKKVLKKKNINRLDKQTRSKKTNHRIIKIILLIFFALFFILASFGVAGVVGDFIHQKIILKVLGVGFPLFPITLLLLALNLFIKKSYSSGWKEDLSIAGLILGVFGLLGSISSLVEGKFSAGYLGNLVASGLFKSFDVYLGIGLAVIIMLISLVSLLGIHNINIFSLFKRKDRNFENDDYPVIEGAHDEEEQEEDEEKGGSGFFSEKKEDTDVVGEDIIIKDDSRFLDTKDYVFPPISLLQKSTGKPTVGDIKANANQIRRTLRNFGIDVEMDEITIGPTITRYALKPAEGVKLSRIVGLQNDLALALAAKSIRIEAPIPGKSLVGIEVPNKTKSLIGLGSLISENEFQKSPHPLLVTLGKGVSGKSYFANLDKMPHALIAGATGAGKSVTVHNFIVSMLYRNSYDELRFIMIDPKRVELTQYNKIPHLLTPVITQPKRAILALKWAIKEMERRYDVLEAESVRDIGSYHKTIVKPAYENGKKHKRTEDSPSLPEKMPYIVIIIDELADLMSAYPRELESSIVRLAQMSRAVGLHLVLSTQRPSVNVITGLIKANIPTRIALKVSSQVDSRTILDTSGAEKLLGAGDMLFINSEMAEPERIQCAYISEKEVKDVVKFIKKHHEEASGDEIILPDKIEEENGRVGGFDSPDDEDPLFEEAREIVIEAKKASTSFLQRKLRIGYSRAARLIDMLEDRGIVGPADGSRPREILEPTVEEEKGVSDEKIEDKDYL